MRKAGKKAHPRALRGVHSSSLRGLLSERTDRQGEDQPCTVRYHQNLSHKAFRKLDQHRHCNERNLRQYSADAPARRVRGDVRGASRKERKDIPRALARVHRGDGALAVRVPYGECDIDMIMLRFVGVVIGYGVIRLTSSLIARGRAEAR